MGELYCKTHHPPTVREKQNARADERRKKSAARYERWEQEAAQKAEQKRRANLYPELLEALKIALDASWDGPMPDYAREKACAAIAKAEGVKP